MKRLLYPFALIFLFSCKKDHLNTGNTELRDQLIVDKKWEPVALNYKQDNGSEGPDVFSSLPEYKKDDYWLFRADGTYEINDNLKLRPGVLTSFIDAGTWKFYSFKEYFQLTSLNPDVRYSLSRIVSLSENELKIEMESEGKIQYFTMSPR
jgi:hypothetical protein